MAQNITRQKDHLGVCKEYITAHRDDSHSEPPPPKRQRMLDFGASSKKNTDKKLAMALFTGARPFTLFQDLGFVEIFEALDPNYHPPSPSTIADSLLSQCYKFLWDDLMKEIAKIKHINLSVDETTNISGKRIVNLSLLTPDRSYYILTEDIEAETLDAATIISWFLKKVTGLFGPPHNWSKINSFTSDTCNLMRSVWSGLRSTPGMEHILTIPCDSHSLQLGIKDLLHLPL
jgi:Protein of unknown function (DUF 659)